jgi:hypothetical protein
MEKYITLHLMLFPSLSEPNPDSALMVFMLICNSISNLVVMLVPSMLSELGSTLMLNHTQKLCLNPLSNQLFAINKFHITYMKSKKLNTLLNSNKLPNMPFTLGLNGKLLTNYQNTSSSD